MNNTSSISGKSGKPETPATDTDTQAAFNKMKTLINECHDEYLKKLYEEHTGILLIPDLVAQDASQSISVLEEMALLGSKESIECLADVSIRIAGFLDALAGSADDVVQQNVKNGKFNQHDPDHEIPRQKLDSVMREALRVLIKAPADVIKIRTEKFDQDHRYSPIIPGACGMFAQSLLESESPPDEAGLIELNIFLARLLGYRGQHLARKAVKEVMADSENWPVIVPALVDGRAKRIKDRMNEIGLGSGLGCDLKGTRLGRTRAIIADRSIKQNTTPTEEVYPIFQILNRVRARARSMSEAHLKEYEKFEKEFATISRITGKNEIDVERELSILRQWNSTNHWFRKAVLLPPPTIKNIACWVDAAVAYHCSIIANEKCADLFAKIKKARLGIIRYDPKTEKFEVPETIRREANNKELVVYRKIEVRVKNSPAHDGVRNRIRRGLKIILQR